MHILVSGSSGLIGSALVARLVGTGHRVTCLARPQSQPAGEGRANVTSLGWDPTADTLDRAALEAAGPFDGVVHLAGAGVGDRRWSTERKRVILTSRTVPTALLTRTLAACTDPPPVLVSASAVGVYGDRGSEVLTEASRNGRGFLADVCAAWEHATESADRAGIRTVHVRTGIVLSSAGGALGRQLPLFRLGLGGRTGNGRQYRSWITVEDHVDVLLRCLTDESLRGPVNATSPEPATDAVLATALGRALHRPSAVPVPALALRAALGREMAGEMVLASQRAVPTKLLAVGHRFAHPDLGEALRSVLSAR